MCSSDGKSRRIKSRAVWTTCLRKPTDNYFLREITRELWLSIGAIHARTYVHGHTRSNARAALSAAAQAWKTPADNIYPTPTKRLSLPQTFHKLAAPRRSSGFDNAPGIRPAAVYSLHPGASNIFVNALPPGLEPSRMSEEISISRPPRLYQHCRNSSPFVKPSVVGKIPRYSNPEMQFSFPRVIDHVSDTDCHDDARCS